MKKLIVVSGLLMATTTATNNVLADSSSSYTELKQGAAFSTAAIAGAALGGPVGMLLGALGGAYLGEQIKDAEALGNSLRLQADLEDEMEQLQFSLEQSFKQQQRIQELALEALESQILFKTASDQLDSSNRLRLRALAKFLRQYPQMTVHLKGHTDPRGTDEYNNVLSHYRAKSVLDELVDAGIAAERIVVSSHGASRSTAVMGDQDAYASERRVDIDVVETSPALLSQSD